MICFDIFWAFLKNVMISEQRLISCNSSTRYPLIFLDILIVLTFMNEKSQMFSLRNKPACRAGSTRRSQLPEAGPSRAWRARGFPSGSLGTRTYVEQAPPPAIFQKRRGGGSTQGLFRTAPRGPAAHPQIMKSLFRCRDSRPRLSTEGRRGRLPLHDTNFHNRDTASIRVFGAGKKLFWRSVKRTPAADQCSIMGWLYHQTWKGVRQGLRWAPSGNFTVIRPGDPGVGPRRS